LPPAHRCEQVKFKRAERQALCGLRTPVLGELLQSRGRFSFGLADPRPQVAQQLRHLWLNAPFSAEPINSLKTSFLDFWHAREAAKSLETARPESRMRRNKALDPSSAKAAKLLRSMRRTQAGIGIAYGYDALMLLGFFAAGFIGFSAPFIFITLCAIQFGAVAWAQQSGWSRKLVDPTLFVPQQLFAISIALGMTLLVPQIGFQPLATLFAISAFSFMAPSTRSLIVCWSAAAVGATTVIFILGPRLAMPTSTLAGQALTGGVVIGLLARCIWIATFVRHLQRRLSEKNAALKAAVERIEVMANRDELTGLANRRAITAWLAEQIDAAGRTGTPLSVAILDIDHFKKINDTYGHHAGDRTLQIFSQIAAETIRGTDRIGRYGGEEFLLVLVGAPLDRAKEPLERTRKALTAHQWDAIEAGLRVTTTIGVAQHSPGETAQELIRRADMALYLGKESGRDRLVIDPGIFQAVTAKAAERAEVV
jgi:diguanylate cyclase